MLATSYSTTHDAQPFDCAVFSPLKTQWCSVCHEHIQANPGKVINKFNFTAFFSKSMIMTSYSSKYGWIQDMWYLPI